MSDFRRCDVTLSEQVNGEVRCNIGYASTGEGIGANSVMWGVDGFYSMPNGPSDDGRACEALVLDGGDKRWVVATKDVRWASKVPNIAPGDRMVASDCDARMMLRREQNQIALYSANEDDNGSTMVIDINGKTGDLQILNGGALIAMTKDSIMLVAGGASIELKDGVVSICGKHFACNTGSGNLGTVGPLPPPVGLGSIVSGATGMAGVGSSKFTVAVALAMAINFAAWAYESFGA